MNSSPEQIDQKEFLRLLYHAAKKGVAEVESLLETYPEHANLAKLTPERYEQVVREEKQRASLRRVLLIAAGALVGLGVLAVLAYYLVIVPGVLEARSLLQTSQSQATIDAQVIGRLQQTVDAQALLLAQTPTPPTEGPTEIPIDEPPTPEPTPSPQVYPASRFFIPPYAGTTFDPALPLKPAGVWLLDAASAELNPAEGWTDNIDTTKSEFKALPGVNASASWLLDQPMSQEGWFALYLSDPQAQSSGLVEVSLLANGEAVAPAIGSGQVVMNSSQSAAPQKAPAWLLVGIYPIPAGAQLEVEARQNGEGQDWIFGVDRAMLIQLAEPDRAILAATQSEGRPVVGLADDANALYEISVGGSFKSTTADWVTTTSISALGGSLHQPVADWASDVRVTWAFPGLLPAGKYEVMAWIPSEHASAPVTYSLLVNGKESAGESPTNGQITQNNEGQWVSLGMWTVAEGDASLAVQMLFAKGAGGEAAADLIVLRKAD